MAVIVTPLHAYFDAAHLDHVIGEMVRRGPPRIRASHDTATGAWFAAEGTHRLRAAARLGLAPVMVPVRWRRGRAALERARFAAIQRGHSFDRVEVGS